MEYLTVSQAVHEYTELKHKSPFLYQTGIALAIKYLVPNSYWKIDSVIKFFNYFHVVLDKNSFLIGPNASLMLTTALIALKDIGIKMF